jgi:hypothetical protein
VGRTHDDDIPPLTLGDHAARGELAAVEDAPEGNREGIGHFLFSQLDERLAHGIRCIGHQNIEPAQFGDGLLDHFLVALPVSNIALQSYRAAAALPHDAGDLFGLVRMTAVVDCNIGSFTSHLYCT